jgi:hypothetical protein
LVKRPGSGLDSAAATPTPIAKDEYKLISYINSDGIKTIGYGNINEHVFLFADSERTSPATFELVNADGRNVTKNLNLPFVLDSLKEFSRKLHDKLDIKKSYRLRIKFDLIENKSMIQSTLSMVSRDGDAIDFWRIIEPYSRDALMRGLVAWQQLAGSFRNIHIKSNAERVSFGLLDLVEKFAVELNYQEGDTQNSRSIQIRPEQSDLKDLPSKQEIPFYSLHDKKFSKVDLLLIFI